MPLSHLSRYELARMLMTRLWRIYDLGGVSYSRSLRAGLLEAGTNLIPFVGKVGDVSVNRVNLDELIDEARKRVRRGDVVHVQRLLFYKLEYASDWDFVCLLFTELVSWYTHDREFSKLPLTLCREVAICIAELISAEKVAALFSEARACYPPLMLIREGKERFRRLHPRVDLY